MNSQRLIFIYSMRKRLKLVCPPSKPGEEFEQLKHWVILINLCGCGPLTGPSVKIGCVFQAIRSEVMSLFLVIMKFSGKTQKKINMFTSVKSSEFYTNILADEQISASVKLISFQLHLSVFTCQRAQTACLQCENRKKLNTNV